MGSGRLRAAWTGKGQRPEHDLLGVIGIVAMLVHATGAPAFSAAGSGARATSVDTEKPATGHFRGGIGNQPKEGRDHYLRLDELIAIEACLV